MSRVFDDRICALGEGPLWHPPRKQLFWFDILGKKLLSRSGEKTFEWQFEEHVSAAGWVDDDTLFMASETGLWRFTISTGARTLISPLEANNPITRSNDGRADPWGGFWIGTMGKQVEDDAGAIYRYFNGELRQLYQPITISNAICFAPSRNHAYYTDTRSRQVMRQPLDRYGWPDGDSDVFLDLKAEKLNPDGAVIDAAGNMWLAQWGGARVAVYDPNGGFLKAVDVGGDQASCPAFGGPDLRDLYVTTAADGLTGSQDGMTFVSTGAGMGQAEHKVLL
jgi:sugar lactone lactonase YvrE